MASPARRACIVRRRHCRGSLGRSPQDLQRVAKWLASSTSVYKPAAVASGVKPLSYKAWPQSPDAGPKAGLRQLHELNQLPGSDLSKLRLKRSANHSGFPECVACQEKRKKYHAAAQTRGADPAEVQKAYQDVIDHQNEWSADRSAALRLMYSTFPQHADAIYECDDGCGCASLPSRGRRSRYRGRADDRSSARRNRSGPRSRIWRREELLSEAISLRHR